MTRRIDRRLLRGTLAASVICIVALDANPVQALQAPQALSCTSASGEISTFTVDPSASIADGAPALFTEGEIISVGLLGGMVFVRSIDRYSLIRTFWMAEYLPGEQERMRREIAAASTADARSAFVRANYAAIITRSQQEFRSRPFTVQCTLVQRAL